MRPSARTPDPAPPRSPSPSPSPPLLAGGFRHGCGSDPDGGTAPPAARAAARADAGAAAAARGGTGGSAGTGGTGGSAGSGGSGGGPGAAAEPAAAVRPTRAAATAPPPATPRAPDRAGADTAAAANLPRFSFFVTSQAAMQQAVGQRERLRRRPHLRQGATGSPAPTRSAARSPSWGCPAPGRRYGARSSASPRAPTAAARSTPSTGWAGPLVRPAGPPGGDDEGRPGADRARAAPTRPSSTRPVRIGQDQPDDGHRRPGASDVGRDPGRRSYAPPRSTKTASRPSAGIMWASSSRISTSYRP